MPELPEVETIARKLRGALTDRVVSRAQILWARTIDRPAPAEFADRLSGAHITGVRRRGKFLVFDLDQRTLLVHLRMSGKFALRAAGEPLQDDRHVRVQMQLDDGVWADYIDPRKFGRFYLVRNSEEVVSSLGPEPLSPEFTPDWLREHLVGRRGELKRLLLDQRFIAGLGNIYASESLWHAGIHPERIAGSLSDEELHRLHRAIVDVLQQGIRHGGTSLADRQYVYPDGGLGEHQEHLAVYDRAGDACLRCGYRLERLVQGQRSTYLCPVCQPRVSPVTGGTPY